MTESEALELMMRHALYAVPSTTNPEDPCHLWYVGSWRKDWEPIDALGETNLPAYKVAAEFGHTGVFSRSLSEAVNLALRKYNLQYREGR